MTRSLIVATSLSLFCFAGCDFVPELPARFQKKDATETKTEPARPATDEAAPAAPDAEPTPDDETSWLWRRGSARPVAYAAGRDRMLMHPSGEGGVPDARACRHEHEVAPAARGVIRIGEDGIVIPGLLRIDEEGVFLSNGLRVTDEGVHVPGLVTVNDEGVVVHGIVQVDGKRRQGQARKQQRERSRERLLESSARRVF